MVRISVIIPTYRNSNTLLKALQSLQEQCLDHFEIIIVNNAADPDIDCTVAGAASDSRVPLRCVPSPYPGVLHEARHAGARAATGEALVFTDDDATFDVGWLQAYAAAFQMHPDMAAAGGPVRPVWEASPPDWLCDFMRATEGHFGQFSLLEPYQQFRLTRVGEFPQGFFFGVNMAIRRDVLFAVGGFNPEAFGSMWLGDGETGLNYKLRDRGMLVGYVPEALVYHHIPAHRMTVDYLSLREANQGVCDAYTEFHRSLPSRLRLCKHAAAIAIRNSKHWVAACLRKGRTDRRSLEIQMQAAAAYARLKYVQRLILSRGFRTLVLKEDWLTKSHVLTL